MALELLRTQDLWAPSTDLGTIASGNHAWLNTTNTLTIEGTNVPTAAWHSIDTSGADACLIWISTSILTVTGGTTVDDAGLSVRACAIPQWIPGLASPFNLPPSLRAAQVASDVGTPAIVFRSDNVLALVPNSSKITPQAYDGGFQADVLSQIILQADDTNAAAGDFVEGSFWIAQRTTTTASTIGTLPRLQGVPRVFLAVKFIPTLATSVTALTLSGGMKALMYRDVQTVRNVGRGL